MATIVESTIGATGDYTTIANWVSGQQGNFVGNAEIHKGILIDSSLIISSQNSITGATTDEDHYWWLTVDENERHTGKGGTGNSLVSGMSVNQSMIFVEDDFVCDWIEFNMNSTTTFAIRAWGTGKDYCKVSNCIFYDGDGSDSSGYVLHFRYYNKVYFWNNLIYDFQPNFSGTFYITSFDNNVNELRIYNNTISDIDSSNGVFGVLVDLVGFTTVECRNCIIVGITAGGAIKCFNVPFSGNHSNNISGDSTVPGIDSFTGITGASLFKDHSNDDYSLKLSSVAYNAGYDLSSYFTNDLAGNSRPFGEHWDIGSLEFLSVSGRIKITEVDTKNLMKIETYVVDFLDK